MRSDAKGFLVVAIGGGVGAFLIASVLGSWTVASALLAVAILAVATYPLIARVRERRFDLLEPIVGGSIALGVIFGIRPIAMLIVGDFAHRDKDTSPEFEFVLGIGLVGTVAFTAAYEWLRQRQRIPTSRDLAPTIESAPGFERGVAFGYLLTLVSLSVALFLIHLSRLGSDVVDGFRLMTGGVTAELASRWNDTTEYLSASPILSACAATLVGVSLRWRLTRRQLAIVVMLVAYPTLVFYLSGDRRYVLPSIGVPLVAWMLSSGTRPGRRVLLTVVPVAFLVLATIPFIRWAEARNESGGVAAAFIEGLGNPARTVNRFILGPDTAMVSALALEVRALRTPQDFFYGRATVGDLLLAPVPHIVFPGKPQTARNEMLIKTYGAPCETSVGGICDDFSIIGTFYQDFWIPGVALLMALVGAASAAIWGRWQRSPLDARLVVVTASWVVFVPIVFRAGFMPAFQWCLYFLVPCLLGAVLSTFQGSRHGAIDKRPRSAF